MHRIATIATSIMPRRIEAQQEAVKSWQDLGFEVISINTEAEIAVLNPMFHGVQFLPLIRPLKSPLIPISEIIEKVILSNTDICGIVNSDIILSAGPDFVDFLWEATSDASLVFGSRRDIDTVNADKEAAVFGYDYFFFRPFKLQLPLIEGFCLGATWWDYWFPTVLGINGFSLRYLMTPVAYHPVHVQQWNESDLDAGKRKFIAAINLAVSHAKSSNDFLRRIAMQGVADAADHISSILLLDSDILFYGNANPGCENLTAMIDLLRLHRKQYEDVLKSKSWRWTAPGRVLIRRLRSLKGRLRTT